SSRRRHTRFKCDWSSDVCFRSVFPQEYVEKEKERTLAEIVSAQDRPQVVAGWAFNELVYQDHPLHRPSHGYPQTVERLERKDLRSEERRVGKGGKSGRVGWTEE